MLISNYPLRTPVDISVYILLTGVDKLKLSEPLASKTSSACGYVDNLGFRGDCVAAGIARFIPDLPTIHRHNTTKSKILLSSLEGSSA